MKKIIIFLGAFTTLFSINNLIKALQIYFIYKEISFWPIAFITMFVTSVVGRYFLVWIYDYIKTDFFSIELFKEAKEKKDIGLKNKLLRKILKLRRYGEFFLYIGLANEPTFVVFYYRKGHHKWNHIPTLKVWILFLLSCLYCTSIFFLSLHGFITLARGIRF